MKDTLLVALLLLLCVIVLQTSCGNSIADPVPPPCAHPIACHYCDAVACLDFIIPPACLPAPWIHITFHGIDCGNSVWVCPEHTHAINQVLFPH